MSTGGTPPLAEAAMYKSVPDHFARLNWTYTFEKNVLSLFLTAKRSEPPCPIGIESMSCRLVHATCSRRNHYPDRRPSQSQASGDSCSTSQKLESSRRQADPLLPVQPAPSPPPAE